MALAKLKQTNYMLALIKKDANLLYQYRQKEELIRLELHKLSKISHYVSKNILI